MEVCFLSSLHETNLTEHSGRSADKVEGTFPETFRHPTLHLGRFAVPGVAPRVGPDSPGVLHPPPESDQSLHVRAATAGHPAAAQHHSRRVSPQNIHFQIKREREKGLEFKLFFSCPIMIDDQSLKKCLIFIFQPPNI